MNSFCAMGAPPWLLPRREFMHAPEKRGRTLKAWPDEAEGFPCTDSRVGRRRQDHELYKKYLVYNLGLMEPMRRLSGPVPATRKQGEFEWSIPLNAKPTAGWIQFFRDSGERGGLINPQRIAFRDAELSFESAEARVTSWVRHIDQWITAANDAAAQAEEKRWEDRCDASQKAEEQSQQLRDADKYREL